MAKFMILFSSDLKASDLMANATPEEMQASMQDWMDWKAEADKSFKVEFGLPLQPVGRITPEGASDGDTKVSGYSTMEGESKESVIEVLKSHPHLKREGAYIDVLEMLSMPGIDS